MGRFGGIRKGRREASDNLSYTEGGDCPRCGGEADSSTMAGYLKCVSCSHEWPDPNYTEVKAEAEVPSYHRDAELIEQFKAEVANGSLANVLGVNKDLSDEQEASWQDWKTNG